MQEEGTHVIRARQGSRGRNRGGRGVAVGLQGLRKIPLVLFDRLGLKYLDHHPEPRGGGSPLTTEASPSFLAGSTGQVKVPPGP